MTSAPPSPAALKAAAGLEPVRERFRDQTALVCAPGPSLPSLWAGRSTDLPKIAVNDAWRIVPGADILYASDLKWWMYHQGVPGFKGGLKVGHGGTPFGDVVCLQDSRKGSLCFDPVLGYLCHGSNSGYSAVHLAAQLGANPIVLVGFDMRRVNDQEHFFGSHPGHLHVVPNYEGWIFNFRVLKSRFLDPIGVRLLNATPNSGIGSKVAPYVSLDEIVGRVAA